MGQVRHGSATTTHAVRAAIQQSQSSLAALSTELGINPKTVAKWRRRATVGDLKTGPKEPRSSVLTESKETMIVAFRRHTLLPLDDCLYALQPTVPHLTRSSLHRYLRRHDISRLPEVEGDKPNRQRFGRTPIGFFHIDIAEVQTADGPPSFNAGVRTPPIARQRRSGRQYKARGSMGGSAPLARPKGKARGSALFRRGPAVAIERMPSRPPRTGIFPLVPDRYRLITSPRNSTEAPMPGDLPDYFFRVRDNGAAVFRVDSENRQRRIEMDQIATVNVRNGDIKPHGDRKLTPDDTAAINDWLEQRQTLVAAREVDDILRTVDHLNQTAHWANARATAEQLGVVTDALLLAMHDLRGVLVRRKAEALMQGDGEAQ